MRLVYKVVYKRNRVGIFCCLSTVHERDRQTNRPRGTVTLIAIGVLSAMSPNNSYLLYVPANDMHSRRQVLSNERHTSNEFGAICFYIRTIGVHNIADPVTRCVRTGWNTALITSTMYIGLVAVNYTIRYDRRV